MSMAILKKTYELPFQSGIPPFLHRCPHLVYYHLHPAFVEPSPVHVQSVDGFAPPFEQQLPLLRELKVI